MPDQQGGRRVERGPLQDVGQGPAVPVRVDVAETQVPELLAPVPETVASRLVHLHDPSRPVVQQERVGGALEQLVELLLALAQGGLRLDPLRDVAEDLELGDAPVGIADARVDEIVGPLVPRIAPLGVDRLAEDHVVHHAPGAGRVLAVEVLVALPAGVAAEVLHQHGIDVLDVEVLRHYGDPVLHRLEHVDEVVVLAPQDLLGPLPFQRVPGQHVHPVRHAEGEPDAEQRQQPHLGLEEIRRLTLQANRHPVSEGGELRVADQRLVDALDLVEGADLGAVGANQTDAVGVGNVFGNGLAQGLPAGVDRADQSLELRAPEYRNVELDHGVVFERPEHTRVRPLPGSHGALHRVRRLGVGQIRERDRGPPRVRGDPPGLETRVQPADPNEFGALRQVLLDFPLHVGDVEGTPGSLQRKKVQVLLRALDPEGEAVDRGVEVQLEVLGVLLEVVLVREPQQHAQREKRKDGGDGRPEPEPRRPRDDPLPEDAGLSRHAVTPSLRTRRTSARSAPRRAVVGRAKPEGRSNHLYAL